MAAVLGAFVSKLAFIMMGMAKDEVEMLLGMPGEITKLETTLGDLSSILADAERKRISSTAVERWVRELKDAMYDVDDILDLCQIMEEGGEDPTAPAAANKQKPIYPRCWSIPKLFCFRNPVAAHEIGKKIQALNRRLSDIAERSSRFGFIVQQINSSSGHSTTAISLSNDNSRMTGPSIIRSDVVGHKIEEDTKKIVDLLVEVDTRVGENTVIAAAITGAGGIGKTTLARMVFNSASVVESFDNTIWLSVTKEVNEVGMMHRVIAAFEGDYDGLAGDIALLDRGLKQLVQQKKFLLVMDDVWSEKVWNDFLRVPLNGGAYGSRVLVTTRDEDVARRMNAHHLHRVDKLEEEDAWILLKKQVVLGENDECEVDRLKDIGMKIVNKCDGLPLAIKVLGGYLLNISRTRDAWINVCNHFAWSTPRINEDIHNAVILSYEELPSHLKQCFVFCSLFPKDIIIRSGEIVQLWIAEGYVDNMTPKLPEDLGLDYYRELISRNLLEPKKGTFLSESTMHDVIRSFAQHITKDEGVLLVSEGQNVNIAPSVSKLRHLSISNKAVQWDALQKQVSLRTLMLFRSTMAELQNICKSLSCLRVLYLDNVNLVELPDSICHLKHLRLLSLSSTSISLIPQVIGDLKFLQAIDLFGCKNITELPNSILKLRKLRLLNIGGTSITSVPRGFGNLNDMVILAGFPYCSDDTKDWCSLEELGPLSNLEILDIMGIEKTSSGSMAAGAKLHSKQHLTDLTLRFACTFRDNGELEDTITEEEKEQIEEVLGNLCPPSCIEKLVIIRYFGNGLPRWIRTMSGFECLRRLFLEGYACCKELPNGLGQLPSLEYFWVERAPCIQYIGHNLLLPPGRKGGAFPKLTRLGFEGMLGWTEWDWEQHAPAMPLLEGFFIDNCKLERLPPGLAHHAGRLVYLDLRNSLHLVSVDNFPSLVELRTIHNPKLERISNCPSLQKIIIFSCPRLKLLEDLSSLQSIEWKDFDAVTLPEYLREAQLNKLTIYCCLSLLKLISLQGTAPEWGKIHQVQQLKAYAACGPEKHVGLDGFIYYTKEPYSFEVVMCDSTVYASTG